MTHDPPRPAATPDTPNPPTPPTPPEADPAAAVLRDPALAALRAVSARIGADPRQVQGGGGNTSLKRDGVLWVKASGRWLARAQAEPMFVPLDLAAVRAGLAAGDAEAAQRAVIAARCPPGLRPSIETSLHALMPHPVVLHAHSIAPLGWLVCGSGAADFAPRLAGLRWAQVPYARPGLALTQAVARALAAGPADVVLLDNHGVVVGADEPEVAYGLLETVSRRLALPLPPRGEAGQAAQAAPAAGREAPQAPGAGVGSDAAFAALEAALRDSEHRLSLDPACHALAREPRRCAFAAGGAPYPDHVVFLGAGLPLLDPPGDAGPAAAAWRARLAALGAPAVLVRGVGVVVHRALDAGGEAMLRCLADVAAALPPGGVPRYLPADEVQALQHWDAEKFRRAQV